jgi:sarcosine oxidase gamma subunit
MIRKGRATVIEAPISVTVAPAGDVIVLDLWAGALPDLGTVRALQVEPRRWWLLDAGDRAGAIGVQLGENGALAPVGGGLMRATLAGPGWRALLMLSGLFDAENPQFGPGVVAATIIHHVPVWIAPLAADACEAWFPASLTADLVALWTRSLQLSGAGSAVTMAEAAQAPAA